MSTACEGFVFYLDGRGFEDALRERVAERFLWQEEYPAKTRLTEGPLPQSIPRSGRLIGQGFELRFVDHGARSILLTETPLETNHLTYSAYGPWKVEVGKGTVPTGWSLRAWHYRDRFGRLTWTRWQAKKGV
jgi:hypothetical protein